MFLATQRHLHETCRVVDRSRSHQMHSVWMTRFVHPRDAIILAELFYSSAFWQCCIYNNYNSSAVCCLVFYYHQYSVFHIIMTLGDGRRWLENFKVSSHLLNIFCGFHNCDKLVCCYSNYELHTFKAVYSIITLAVSIITVSSVSRCFRFHVCFRIALFNRVTLLFSVWSMMWFVYLLRVIGRYHVDSFHVLF